MGALHNSSCRFHFAFFRTVETAEANAVPFGVSEVS
jgi:hypothetical protein